MIVMDYVTHKAAAKLDLLFNTLAFKARLLNIKVKLEHSDKE